ncbi:hypothetical protein V5O48_019237, partial [Marasmius crinis-equi]
MPLLVDVEASCMVPESFLAAPMTLRTSRTRSRRVLEAEEHERARMNIESGSPRHSKSNAPGHRKEGGTHTRENEEPAVVEPEPVTEIRADKPEAEEVRNTPSVIGESEDEDTDVPVLETVVAQGKDGIDLRSILKDKYDGDAGFREIMKNPKVYRNFEVEDGLVFVRLPDRRLLCIPKLVIGSRNVREIIIDEAHSILAHLGPKKTLA